MKPIKPKFHIPLLAILVATAACGAVSNASAKLPPSVDGTALPSLADMLEKVTPAVVNIHAEGREVLYDPASNDPVLRHFFGNAIREKQTRGTGSGIIVNAQNGFILTNSHVIAGADKIKITLNDHREFSAEIVGSDPQSDLSILKIPPINLTAIKFADSDKLRVGDFAVAIGNPYGLGQSVSSGIVSALGRNNLGIEDYENFIQTDAPINPGNSGGALINLRGELIGINTAILGGNSGGNVGIGFAIPSNMASNIMHQLVKYGEVHRGQLGVILKDLDSRLASLLHVQVNSGVLIDQLVTNSPAARSGLMAGDIITQINGNAVRNSADVRTRIGNLRVATNITLNIIRDGHILQIKTMIGEVAQNIPQIPDSWYQPTWTEIAVPR